MMERQSAASPLPLPNNRVSIESTEEQYDSVPSETLDIETQNQIIVTTEGSIQQHDIVCKGNEIEQGIFENASQKLHTKVYKACVHARQVEFEETVAKRRENLTAQQQASQNEKRKQRKRKKVERLDESPIVHYDKDGGSSEWPGSGTVRVTDQPRRRSNRLVTQQTGDDDDDEGDGSYVTWYREYLT